jgi:hypothetical protein
MTSPEQADAIEAMTQEILGAVARAYCHPRNSHKGLDGDLAEAIAHEIIALDRLAAVALHPQPPDVHLAQAQGQAPAARTAELRSVPAIPKPYRHEETAGGGQITLYTRDQLVAYAKSVALHPAPSEPVAWIRQHPDGTLTNEVLPNWMIEPVRRDSGAWLPLVLVGADGVVAARGKSETGNRGRQSMPETGFDSLSAPPAPNADQGRSGSLPSGGAPAAREADERSLPEFAAALASRMKRLPPDMAKVLVENLWDLYERAAPTGVPQDSEPY